MAAAGAGEFVGKWLTHAAQLYRLTKHPELHATVTMALATLTKTQAPDGYLLQGIYTLQNPPVTHHSFGLFRDTHTPHRYLGAFADAKVKMIDVVLK